MKTKHIVITTVILACIVSPLLAKGGKGNGGGTTPVLSDKEASDLIFLREEEKLARDVYLALYGAWGTPIFLNISASEQKHTDAVANLIAKYGLEDPVVDDTPGVFTNPDLAQLYIDLVTQGTEETTSLTDALDVGVFIEELDIHDIKDLMFPDATQTDVQRVLANLLAGSYNHLDAFEKSLAALTE